MRIPFILLVALSLLAGAYGIDIDTGRDAVGATKLLESPSIQPGWVRMRGAEFTKAPETRIALQELRERGLKTCILLRRSERSWNVKYVPEDLHEVYERSRKLGAAYGDLVDAWEIDNEPDLGFVPEAAERYTAYLKACYLGLKAGSKEQGAGSKQPLVVMGALGLPPGSWLARFAANNGFSYTDGFNYHYYGYAEDFSGVYRQFESAVSELARQNLQNGTGNSVHSVKKDLPIFLTEIGYGMLGKSARDTGEGRLRQWRWFKTVGEQADLLHIEAPMAFYLPPYLEYGASEFGLTVSKVDRIDQISPIVGQGVFTAGGIEYTPGDFGTKAAEPWMSNIGKEIGGNEITPALAQWLVQRAKGKEQGVGSRSWSVAVAAPSPIVIDFLPGEGLLPLKRYGGSFVTGTVTSLEHGARSKEAAVKSESTSNRQPTTNIPKPRSEEFTVHVRTQNGNLYEVYPTRQATPEWQTYLEQQDNFTMSFYGRAELPWRFGDNKPASLVVVMYPKALPATYEFRRVQLLKLGAGSPEPGAEPQVSGLKSQVSPSVRYGRGQVVLYNFSDAPVKGRLVVSEGLTTDFTDKTDGNQVGRVVPNAPNASEGGGLDIQPSHKAMAASVIRPITLTLAPGERRVLNVSIKVDGESFQRTKAAVLFEPENTGIPAARFETEFFPALEGMKTTVVAELLRQPLSALSPQLSAFILNRPRATEEAPMFEQGARSKEQGAAAPQVSGPRSQVSGGVFFAQQGAKLEKTAEGFTVTVTGTPPGKEQRVEVEIPWPEQLDFSRAEFLSLEFRLHP